MDAFVIHFTHLSILGIYTNIHYRRSELNLLIVQNKLITHFYDEMTDPAGIFFKLLINLKKKTVAWLLIFCFYRLLKATITTMEDRVVKK